MLKHTIVCVMLVAAAAMGWRRLDNVPSIAQVDTNAHLVWGGSKVWGVFPTHGTHVGTYLFCYDPHQSENPDSCFWNDSLPMMSGACLSPCNITFQPAVGPEPPVLWGIGKTANTSYLKQYFTDSDQWVEHSIDSFDLGAGATIAYAPNPNYNPQSNPIPGWLYCLPGGDTSFWQYGVPATLLADSSQYGYLYPDTGATIANPTPTFRWNPGVQQYRIQVSTDSTFSAGLPLIDTVVATNEYESTVDFTNGTYYWRVAGWSRGQWLWMTARHYWFSLVGGWTQVKPIDSIPRAGAEIAYDAGSFPIGGSGPGIIAIYGGSRKLFSRYDIGSGDWQFNTWHKTPWHVRPGSSLTTSALVEGAFPYHVDAAFDSQPENDYPWLFYANPDTWEQFILEQDSTDYYTGFPDKLDLGSSMIIGADSMSYLTTGHDHYFYRVEPAGFAGRGGEQGAGKALVSPVGGAKAKVLAFHDGVEVQYQLPVAARVRAVLHDAVGRRVGTLDAGEQKAGTHRLCWSRDQEGRKLSAGAYFVLLDMGSEQARLKAVVR